MRKQELRFLLIMMGVALAIRLFRIGAQSLWVDELLTITISNPRPGGPTIWGYVFYNIHGPLHNFVVYLFHLVSMNDGWLRVPSALAGTASVFFLYRWIDLWLGRRIARIATILLVICPLHVHYSQEVRNYSFLFLFVTVAGYYFQRLLAEDGRRNYVLYTIALAAAALSNFTAAFLYAAQTVIYFARRGPVGKRVLRWALVSLAVAVLISPWLYRMDAFIRFKRVFRPVMPGQIATEERLRGRTTMGPSAIPYLFYTFSVGFTLGPSTRELHHDAGFASVVRRNAPAILWVALLFGPLAVAGFVYFLRRGDPWGQLLLYLLLPLLFTILLNWQNAKAFNVRYVLVALPAYLCVIAGGVATLRTAAARVVFALLVATLALSLGNHYYNGRYAKSDVRAAARHIDRSWRAGECVLAPVVREVFEKYSPHDDAVVRFYATTATPRETVDAQLEKIFAKCGGLWYIRAREWEYDASGYVAERLASAYHPVETIEYNGVTLTRFAR